MRIYKYPLYAMTNEIKMPKGSKPLCVQLQHGEPCLWVESNDYAGEHEIRHFVIYTTGAEIPELDTHYIGTFQADDGNLSAMCTSTNYRTSINAKSACS